MWTRKSYDALYDWMDAGKRDSARKAMLADGLDDVVARLDTAKNIGEWYKITHEAVEAVGTGVVEASATQAEKELNKMAAVLGRKGGAAKTERKAVSSRENGKKGGRPKTKIT